jgi:hypothetical protein
MRKRSSTQHSLETQVAIKRDLAQWLDQTRSPAQRAATIIALLETALDQYLADRTSTATDLAPAAADATDTIQAVLRRAVRRRRAALEMDPSRLKPAPTIPISDAEWADRLTEMLKLLDTLPTRLHDSPAGRQLLDDADAAAEPLSMLLGYFIDSRDPEPPVKPFDVEEWS